MQLRLPVLPAMTAVSVQPVKKLAGTSASVTSSAARLSAARRGEPGSRSMASQGDGIHVADVDEPRLVAHARHGNHKVAAPGEYFELLNLHGTEYWMAQLRHPLLSQRLDIALDLASYAPGSELSIFTSSCTRRQAKSSSTICNLTISLLCKPIVSHLQIRDVHVAAFTVRRPSHRVCRPCGLTNDVVGTYSSWTTCCATYLPFGITGYLHRFWQ